MKFRTATQLFVLILSSALGTFTVHAKRAESTDLPPVKADANNPVLTCATPGRLMAFIKARNDKLDSRFDDIAVAYMQHGRELGMRWDFAFFQMLLETGNLKFGGDVKASQNNFAGLGATGNGERGESFKDVSTGVRAHLEHLLMYAGEKIENPVAERTRKVQEWGVLTEWQKTIKGPMTFTHLARKWAPPARKYAQDIETVSESFIDGICKAADPHPEMVALTRKVANTQSAAITPPLASVPNEIAKVDDGKLSGKELAKRAVADARADGTGKRLSLGAAGAAKDAIAKDQKAQAFALLNPPKPETDETATATKVAVGGMAKSANRPTSPCKVFQASYGGAKFVIIKAVIGEATNYTVLDVNEGAEAREAEAYIAAFAPGGRQVGEFKSQTMALDKAFEMCPEG